MTNMEKLEPKRERNPVEILARKLDALQSEKNGGRGISCIRTLIFYLDRGDIDSAKAVFLNESDKIRNYPDIKLLLDRELSSKN